MLKAISIMFSGLLFAGPLSADCGQTQAVADLTVSCAPIPYKLIARISGFTAANDSVQLLVTSTDPQAAGYRVSLTITDPSLATTDPNATRTSAQTVLGSRAIVEFPVPDVSTTKVLSVQVEKLRADPAITFFM
jgi:hypothetical protein